MSRLLALYYVTYIVFLSNRIPLLKKIRDTIYYL